MDGKAVAVSFKHPTTNETISGSGIVIDNQFVITSGSILLPLLHIPSQHHWLHSFVSSLHSHLQPDPHLDKNVTFMVVQGPNKVKNGTILATWKCPLISKSVDNLFHDWSLGDVSRGHNNANANGDADAAKHLMAVFILLSIDSQACDPREGIQSFERILGVPHRGQDIIVESTPFGVELFFNSLSRGIVSNVIGEHRCLLLTDARTVSGCEGGPIFEVIDNRLCGGGEGRKLLGLVSCSLTWWRGEWVGFTVGVLLSPVFRNLLLQPPIPINKIKDKTVELVDETVVLVRCGSSWGSGVVVKVLPSKAVILTCSHVVRNEKSDKVTVLFRGESYSAEVIYRTADNLAYDIALLRVPAPHPFSRHMDMDDIEPEKGDAVLAAGFPLFSERDERDLLPTFVHGCIARICPSMIQTTCCIQSGASGGPLLRGDKLLGLVVCNAKDSSTGALFPHVSFAVPVSAFRDQINKYVLTEHIPDLHSLQPDNGRLQTLWRLQSNKL